MNTLLVNALSYVGSEVLDHLATASKPSEPGVSFAGYLEPSPTAPASLSAVLETRGIETREQLRDYLGNLADTIRHHPDLPPAARTLAQDPTARLRVGSQGELAIAAGDKTIPLPAEGDLADKAREFDCLHSLYQAQGLMPQTPLRDFATRFQPAHAFTVHWPLA